MIFAAHLTSSVRCWRKGISSLRFASSSSNPLPFPSHPNPTAHQIFHLPVSASQVDIKARYYELVRLYHPDSQVSRSISPEKAQARFHAISAAYKILRGKSIDPGSADIDIRKNHNDLNTAIWKETQRRRAELKVGGIDDKWKDRLLLGSIVLVIATSVVQTFMTRRQVLRDSLHNSRHPSGPVGRSRQDRDDSDVSRLAAPEPELPTQDSTR